jgi:hypothetical protein
MSTAHRAAANMPEVWAADHRLLGERAMILLLRGTEYPDTLAFQVVIGARLADKAAQEWVRAERALADYAHDNQQFSRLYDGTGDLENFIISLDRLIRFVHAVVSTADVDPANAHVASLLRGRLRSFRNRLIHGDEDIEAGRAGMGFPTGTLEVLESGVAIGSKEGGGIQKLGFTELATALSELRRYLTDVIQG